MSDTSILRLDAVCLHRVFSLCELGSLFQAAATCSAWRNLLQDQEIWHHALLQLEPEGLLRADLLPAVRGSWQRLCGWRFKLWQRRVSRLCVEGEHGGPTLATIPVASSGSSCEGDTRRAPLAAGEQLLPGATWAPCGGYLAYAVLFSSNHRDWKLVVADEHLREVCSLQLERDWPAFYFSWSPCGTFLAFLSNWHDHRVALRVVDMAAATLPEAPAGKPVLVTSARPLFVSWAPHSHHLLAFGDGRNASLVDVRAGLSKPLVTTPRLHWFYDQHPQWITGAAGLGDILVLGRPADGPRDPELAAGQGSLPVCIHMPHLKPQLTELAAASWTPVVPDLTLTTASIYTASPSGELVAWVESNDGAPLRCMTRTRSQEVFVCHRGATERPLRVSLPETDAPAAWQVLTLQWSPDSKRLLLLTVTLSGNRLADFRWVVWTRGTGGAPHSLQAGARHLPSAHFMRTIHPFMQQYMQSIRFWSPDSAAFCYTCHTRPGGDHSAPVSGSYAIRFDDVAYVQPLAQAPGDGCAGPASAAEGGSLARRTVVLEPPPPVEVQRAAALATWS